MAQHVFRGTAAPATTPTAIGQHYIDTVAGAHYLSKGTSSSADWVLVGISTPLPATQGGTGQSTYTTGDLLYASASNTLSKLPAGSSGQVLKMGASVPAWSSDTGTGITELTGDVTAGPGSGSQDATIANSAVTYAKMQDVTTARLLGRATAGTGVVEEITLGTNLSFSGTTLDASNTPPGGADTQIQFNDGGAFGADSALTFNKTSKLLTAKNMLVSGGLFNQSGPTQVSGAFSSAPYLIEQTDAVVTGSSAETGYFNVQPGNIAATIGAATFNIYGANLAIGGAATPSSVTDDGGGAFTAKFGYPLIAPGDVIGSDSGNGVDWEMAGGAAFISGEQNSLVFDGANTYSYNLGNQFYSGNYLNINWTSGGGGSYYASSSIILQVGEQGTFDSNTNTINVIRRAQLVEIAPVVLIAPNDLSIPADDNVSQMIVGGQATFLGTPTNDTVTLCGSNATAVVLTANSGYTQDTLQVTGGLNQNGVNFRLTSGQGQTGNLFEAYNYGGTLEASLTQNGDFACAATANIGSRLIINGTDNNTDALQVTGTSSFGGTIFPVGSADIGTSGSPWTTTYTNNVNGGSELWLIGNSGSLTVKVGAGSANDVDFGSGNIKSVGSAYAGYFYPGTSGASFISESGSDLEFYSGSGQSSFQNQSIHNVNDLGVSSISDGSNNFLTLSYPNLTMGVDLALNTYKLYFGAGGSSTYLVNDSGRIQLNSSYGFDLNSQGLFLNYGSNSAIQLDNGSGNWHFGGTNVAIDSTYAYLANSGTMAFGYNGSVSGIWTAGNSIYGDTFPTATGARLDLVYNGASFNNGPVGFGTGSPPATAQVEISSASATALLLSTGDLDLGGNIITTSSGTVNIGTDSSSVQIGDATAAVGFLGASPSGQLTGGSATAGGSYTSTEQNMLQTVYDALRTFGFLN